MNLLDTLKLSTAAKAWVSFLGLALEFAQSAAPLDTTGHTVLGVVLAVLGAVGVYVVPNKPAAPVTTP